jgi:hypothetical protein
MSGDAALQLWVSLAFPPRTDAEPTVVTLLEYSSLPDRLVLVAWRCGDRRDKRS